MPAPDKHCETIDLSISIIVTVITSTKINLFPHHANYNLCLTGGEMRYPKEDIGRRVAINTLSVINADVYAFVEAENWHGCRKWGNNRRP